LEDVTKLDKETFMSDIRGASVIAFVHDLTNNDTYKVLKSVIYPWLVEAKIKIPGILIGTNVQMRDLIKLGIKEGNKEKVFTTPEAQIKAQFATANIKMFTHFAPGAAQNDEDMVKEVVAVMHKQITKNVTNF
jgi:hypothetical protein